MLPDYAIIDKGRVPKADRDGRQPSHAKGGLIGTKQPTKSWSVNEKQHSEPCKGLRKALCTGKCGWKDRKCRTQERKASPPGSSSNHKKNNPQSNKQNPIERATPTSNHGHRGKVYVYGRGDLLPPGVVTFNVTSRSKDEWCRDLSPFFLGPVDVYPYTDTHFHAKRFENAWQYLKMYPQFNDNRDAYLAWASEGFAKEKADRFPMGKGAKPMYSVWKGSQLGYIEARFKIYAPLYAKCIEETQRAALQKMRQVLESGKDIALFDFDGYNYMYNGQTLEQVMYNSKRKLGHAFIIAMILTGQRVWESPYDPRKIHASSMKRSK